MDETAARGRAARLLAVLAVLLGLLAMHGVASAHHAGASPAGHGVLPATSPASAHSGGSEHGHGAAATGTGPVAQQDAASMTTPAGPTCLDDCPSITALCVAVLTGVALALLLARRHVCPLVLAPARHAARAPTPPARHVRGPDPVRVLCVSRT